MKIKKQSATLDLKDKKILYELDVNARQSASVIGKKVGLSKQVVTYRINKLIKDGIIQKFYAVYDTSKLGFTAYKIFIRLQNTDIKKQTEIINYLKNHPSIQFFVSCDGMFDLIFNFLAKNVGEVYDLIKDFENKYGRYISEKEIIIMVFSSFFFRDYLIEQTSVKLRKPIYFGSKPENINLDEINKKILHYLGIDAKMPIVDIAHKLKLSPDAISLRIKKLEKAHIIHNYLVLPNFAFLNQTSYKILFSLHNLNKKREKAIFDYCKSQPNIWFHSKSLGKWDLEINMDVESANKFREIMMEIKLKFSDIIKEYNTLQISENHKFNFYPFKIKN